MLGLSDILQHKKGKKQSMRLNEEPDFASLTVVVLLEVGLCFHQSKEESKNTVMSNLDE